MWCTAMQLPMPERELEPELAAGAIAVAIAVDSAAVGLCDGVVRRVLDEPNARVGCSG